MGDHAVGVSPVRPIPCSACGDHGATGEEFSLGLLVYMRRVCGSMSSSRWLGPRGPLTRKKAREICWKPILRFVFSYPFFVLFQPFRDYGWTGMGLPMGVDDLGSRGSRRWDTSVVPVAASLHFECECRCRRAGRDDGNARRHQHGRGLHGVQCNILLQVREAVRPPQVLG